MKNGLVEKYQSDEDQIRNEANREERPRLCEAYAGDTGMGMGSQCGLQLDAPGGPGAHVLKGIQAEEPRAPYRRNLIREAVYANKFDAEVLQAFEKARRRRNESLYDRAGSISETQGRNLVQYAEKFVSKTLELLNMK